MTHDQLDQALRQALMRVAPEADAATLDSGRLLRRQVDIDSADWLNFLIEIERSIGVAVEDAQAGRLDTLAKLADYCAARLPAS
ncbi:MAG: acyl carrier protein [Betaproteobacteria bacterium]